MNSKTLLSANSQLDTQNFSLIRARVAFLDALPDPATTRLYPEYIGDDIINDAILNCVLEPLSLYERDALKVQQVHEDLTPERQHALGLRSAPSQVARIFAACAVRARFGDQSGHAAPLYNDGDGMKMYAPAHGLIFQVQRGGLARGWLHYKQPTDRAPHWVSSSHLPGGCKVVPSIHVVNPEPARTSGVVTIANHALEAECLAHGVPLSVVGLNGVMPSALVSQLLEQWNDLLAVRLYLDAASPFLVRALQRAGLKVEVA